MNRDSALLARYAEGLFWMARYLERVENMARLVDVTETFESPGREAESWNGLIRINADEAGFARRAQAPTAENVKRFYLTDIGNPTSVPASMEAARTNARALRPLISTEMWVQLNIFHREILGITSADLQGDRLSRLCDRIKVGVQTHTGITDGTFFRDQGWVFYQIGRLIERADQTTRLLDIRYHLLVPSGGEERRVAELTQWGGVLRAAAGYHAFRRVAPAGFKPEDVVSFLLTDAAFPRSVTLCVEQIEWLLSQLRGRYGLRGTVASLERVEELRGGLRGRPVERIIADGLHDFLDGVQRDLILLAGEIGTAFFRDWRPFAEPAGQSQSQSQSQSGGGSQSQSQSQSQGEGQSQGGTPRRLSGPAPDRAARSGQFARDAWLLHVRDIEQGTNDDRSYYRVRRGDGRRGARLFPPPDACPLRGNRCGGGDGSVGGARGALVLRHALVAELGRRAAEPADPRLRKGNRDQGQHHAVQPERGADQQAAGHRGRRLRSVPADA